MTLAATSPVLTTIESPPMVVRHARVADASAISALVSSWSDQGYTLRRSPGAVLAMIGRFVVVESRGALIACACFEECGRSVGEVRSVAVAEHAKGMGAGRAVLAGVVQAADQEGLKELYLLTKIPAWFERGGFVEIAFEEVPAWWMRERVLDAGRSVDGRSAMRRRVP